MGPTGAGINDVVTMAAVPVADVHALTTAERAALVSDWKRLQAEPPPPDRRSIGCMSVVIAVALGAAGPPFARFAGIDAPPPVKLGLGIALGLIVVAGLIVALFMGSGRFARDLQRAEQAIHWLAANGVAGDPEERRKQTVSLLLHAYCTDGPSTVNTIDFGKARERLGDALPHVLAAERALRADLGINPVFTDSKGEAPA